MRSLAAALAIVLLAAPAWARTRNSSKGPRAGGYCSKSAIGTTSTDRRGVSLQCKAGRNGKARWVRQ
jgi:hypothetical protein